MNRPIHHSIAVTLVEDQRVIREGLALLIDHTTDFRCAGAFGTMEEALERVETGAPDVMLVDLGLPGMSGVEGIRQLRASHPRLPVLVLTVYGDDDRIFDAILVGACGHVLKTAPPEVLLACLRAVAEGGAPMTSELARKILRTWREGRPETRLTADEERILRKLAEGHVYKTAAADLHLPVRELGLQMRSVYDKLHRRAAGSTVFTAWLGSLSETK